MDTKTKICTNCNTEKPKSEFKNRGGNQKHLLKSWCKTCHYKHHKSWVDSNPEKVRTYRAKDKWTLKKRTARHGISEEDFWSMYENQDGSCVICDKAIQAEDSAIDHNHQTGEVRGILCKSCNRGLGLLGDSVENLKRAVEYLKENGSYGS